MGRQLAAAPCQSGVSRPSTVRLRRRKSCPAEKKWGMKRGSSSTSQRRYRLFHLPLTSINIRQAKAGDKPTKLTDANGLYLFVKPSGSRLRRCDALYGTANHRVSEGSRGRHAGQGTVHEARVQCCVVLNLTYEVLRHGSLGSPPARGPRGGACPAEDTAGLNRFQERV